MNEQRYGKPDNRKAMKALIAVFVVFGIVATSLLILKYVPMNYEEKHYSQSVGLEPQQTKNLWFTVPKGYTVSGVYWTGTSDPVEISVSFQSPTTYLLYNVLNEKKNSGSFSFGAQTVAVDDRYTFNFRNPASSGLFGFGAGSSIAVTVDCTVSGYTTYLK